MNVTAQPRFIILNAATGESIPPDKRATTRPAVPVGRPPEARVLSKK